MNLFAAIAFLIALPVYVMFLCAWRAYERRKEQDMYPDPDKQPFEKRRPF